MGITRQINHFLRIKLRAQESMNCFRPICKNRSRADGRQRPRRRTGLPIEHIGADARDPKKIRQGSGKVCREEQSRPELALFGQIGLLPKCRYLER